jgi:hypothetical protein
MLNTIKFFLKRSLDANNNEKNKIINISKTIQSNIDKDIFALFQKEPFSKIDNEDTADNYDTEDSDINSEDTEDYSAFQNDNLNSESDSDNESDLDDGNESDPDIKIIKDIINENDLKQKKHGSNNNPTISFQYDISELINAIK